MRPAPVITPLASRLAFDLSLALLGQGVFTTGRPESRQALGALHDGLAKQLRNVPQVALLAGRPSAPLAFLCWGFAAERLPLEGVLPADSRATLLSHLAGFWRDRRLLLLALHRDLSRPEFEQLMHLLAVAGDKGPLLRKRYLEERLRGHLPNVTLLFADDLPEFPQPIAWPVQGALAWLQRDLNLLSRQQGLPAAVQTARRQALLEYILELAGSAAERRDLLANLDLLVEQLHDYDRDEFAYLLIGKLDAATLAEVCTELCTYVGRLQQRLDDNTEPAFVARLEAGRWITRRVAEELIETGQATPAHYHALVLQKILLYEEIPPAMRPRVAALQVLTSFLANPQRYFSDIEGSHSPEVLEKRLWRLLEMLPNLLRACRFDAAREVVAFAQRFGPTFDLSRNPDLLTQVREAAAEILAVGETAQQAELMKALPQMGRSGLHLLIDLADHSHRSVRRVALDGLVAAGPAVTPVLFETLEHKPGWHYLRNMLVIIGKVGAGGPKVEELFRQGLEHVEAGVRKEALPGIARLLRENAAALVAERLHDPDPEVRRRAVACLGATGIPSPATYERLAELLAAKEGDELALAVAMTLNRLRPGPQAGLRIEAALIELVKGGWFGIGKGTADRSLRLEAIKALGQFPSTRARKTLERLLKENDAAVARAAQEALAAG